MTEQELQQQRAIQWRVAGNPIRTLDDARSFLDDVGFCLVYPVRSLLAPTFLGAYAGSAEGLPEAKQAFADPRTQPAIDLMVRLLRERSAFELLLPGEIVLLVAASLFPFFYVLFGDRNPKGLPHVKVSPLAMKVFEVLRKRGPLGKLKLRELVGHEPTPAALDRALGELWAILKITRVDYRKEEGALWDVLYRWARQALNRTFGITFPEALTALLSKYLESVIAADQDDIERFFSMHLPRQKIREAIHALQAARQLSYLTVGSKTLTRMAPLLAESGTAQVRNKRRTLPDKNSVAQVFKDKSSSSKDSSETHPVNKGLRRRG
ncbi:MAG TPA: hypothetical protein VHA33_28945 [Candidatus Angelobacter sp.]|jgi:hypothetical protein|nr:hypothetical protein [Candidatus Angelobacter sp.]